MKKKIFKGDLTLILLFLYQVKYVIYSLVDTFTILAAVLDINRIFSLNFRLTSYAAEHRFYFKLISLVDFS